MTVTRLLATVMGDNKINDAKICRKIAVNFDHHGDALAQSRVHHPMKHIKGFTRSHWMLPSGKCLRCSTPAAAMVPILGENTEH
jgi:hypothetical protein